MIQRVLVATLALSLFIGVTAGAGGTLPPGGSFTDDDGNIHEASIEAIAAEGITRGCNPPTNDLYCPNATDTRGQMAAFLVRALGLTASDPGIDFTDDNDSIFEADIEKLATAGPGRVIGVPVMRIGALPTGHGARPLKLGQVAFEGDLEEVMDRLEAYSATESRPERVLAVVPLPTQGAKTQ